MQIRQNRIVTALLIGLVVLFAFGLGPGLAYKAMADEKTDITERMRSPTYYGEQDEKGVDLSLIRENLRLSPTERARRADRARRDALRLLEYGRRGREERS